MTTEMVLPKGSGERREMLLSAFASQLKTIQEKVPFRISARGWCYQLEGFGLITKAEFDKVETAINECRSLGYIPIDFTAEEEGRKFHGIETKEEQTPAEYIAGYADYLNRCENGYTPDWWADERFPDEIKEGYYIQMLVEKIDLVSLFEPVCREYKIPIATSKGWSSMLQRAEYARRFKEAEDRGLQCVLLYCGDFDPDGLRISERIVKNLDDLKNIVWRDGEEGYDPSDLIVERFGLEYPFIVSNNLTWIDNLMTGSGGYLAKKEGMQIVQGRTNGGKPHPNFKLPYAQEYLHNYGVRKCEANALVIRPEQAHELCRTAIEKYLGNDARERFRNKRKEKDGWFDEIRETITVGELSMGEAIEKILFGLGEYDLGKEE
jgi:hypothetical protein